MFSKRQNSLEKMLLESEIPPKRKKESPNLKNTFKVHLIKMQKSWVFDFSISINVFGESGRTEIT